MPLFWKKNAAGSGSPKLKISTNDNVSPKSSPVHKNETLPVLVEALPLLNQIETRQSLQFESFFDDDGSIRRRSRLSLNLKNAIADAATRHYFLSFLELRDAAHLLQFLLDIESFEASAKSRFLSQSRNNTKLARSRNEDETHKAINNNSQSDVELAYTSSVSTLEDDAMNSLGEVSQHSDENVLLNLHKSVACDAVKIFNQYLAKDSNHPVGVTNEQRDEVARKICCEDGRVDPSCFRPVQLFVYSVLQKEHFNLFLQSVYYCKYQLDVLTAASISIVDILYNENALVYFMEFMEQENQRDLVEFWLTTDNFYQHYAALKESEYDSSQIQDDAMVIYEKYFSLQASCPMGFNDNYRFDIEQKICRIGGPLPTCFDNATHLVLQVLERTFLGLFLGSQIYVKYLTELVNLVQACSFPYENRKRTGSDTSSEQSTHTVNTLLAMDGNQPGVPSKKLVKKFEAVDMQIDTSKFVPDALWRRPLSGKLRLGFVNNMGQYITEFEPEPDKRRSGESRFTRAVKRLMYKDEDKAKEEMALQVAKMIIHEVVSVTLQARPMST